MKKGKLIVIEGTDCSGKETQTKKLMKRFEEEGIPCESMSFPIYSSPTGRIVGGPYLGKPEICESWFSNGANGTDSKIASLYYAADRRMALPKMLEILDSGKHLILDRYVSANMGHQGGKIRSEIEREKFYEGLENLEHGFLELPQPDLTVFLYMPYQVGMNLNKGREGKADGHESSPENLKNAEEAYLQLADIYDWIRVECAPDGTKKSLRTREDIHEEVYKIISRRIIP